MQINHPIPAHVYREPVKRPECELYGEEFSFSLARTYPSSQHRSARYLDNNPDPAWLAATGFLFQSGFFCQVTGSKLSRLTKGDNKPGNDKEG